MRIALVFTNDWELFGDGSGDYFDVQHKPLVELTSLMEGYGAKLSIMAETFQQLHHKQLMDSEIKFNKIVDEWEMILKKSYINGHDVQLHIHPQWNESVYRDGEWVLGNNWSIGKREKNEISDFIGKGKQYLESLLNEISEDYKCNVYRAGAYYIEPSSDVISVLKENEFICDTSVTKGTYVDGYYDYRNAYSNINPWSIGSKGVNYKSDKSGIIELPIHSAISVDSEVVKKFIPEVYYKLRFGVSISKTEINWMKERDKIKSIRYPSNRRAYKKHENKNLGWYLNKILSKNAVQLDYDYVPSSVFVKMLKNVLNDKQLKKYKNTDTVIPIVASGHVKDMHNTDNVERILEGIKSELSDKVEYWTISEAANYSIKHLI